MLSILGCFIRALWYFIASIYDLVNRGSVDKRLIFCQASGFFIRLGNGITGLQPLNALAQRICG